MKKGTRPPRLNAATVESHLRTALSNIPGLAELDVESSNTMKLEALNNIREDIIDQMDFDDDDAEEEDDDEFGDDLDDDDDEEY